MDENNVHPDALNFYAEIPCLQTMASNRVLSLTLHSHLSRLKYEAVRGESIDALVLDHLHKYKSYHDSINLLYHLNLPDKIVQLMKPTMMQMLSKLTDWVKFFKVNLFSSTLQEFRIRNLRADWCVWRCDGEIDYEKSAHLMLSDARLSQIQRFAVMSVFCMENEIKDVSVRSIPHHFIEQVNFAEESLLCYWICFLNNKLHEIPLDAGCNSIDVSMAMKCEERNWFAFRYFWYRLNVEDRLSVARLWIKSRHSMYPERFFGMLSRKELVHLLTVVPERVILKFSLFSNFPKISLWAWMRSKDDMNVDQFAILVLLIVRHVDVEASETAMEVLNEIWLSADDRLKNYVIQTWKHIIIKLLSDLMINSQCACEFFFKFIWFLASIDHEQNLPLFPMSGEMLACFIIRLCRCREITLWIWEYSKNVLSAEEFTEMMREVLTTGSCNDEVIDIMIQVWHSAANDHKEYAVEMLEDEIMDFLAVRACTLAAYEFIRDVLLSLHDQDYVTRLIHHNVSRFQNTHCCFGSPIGEYMYLFLPNFEDQLRFKKLIADSDNVKDNSVMLFLDSDFKTLNVMLNFYLPESDVRKEFQMWLIQSDEVLKTSCLTSAKKWNEISKFIDDIFLNDSSSSAIEMKKKFITSVLSNKPDLNFNLDKFNEMINIVESTFNNEEVVTIKKTLAVSYQSLFTNQDEYWWMEYFTERYFHVIRKWCFGDDEEAIEAFKKNIHTDAIFCAVLCGLNKVYECSFYISGRIIEYLLIDLDKCLKWYLPSDEAVKSYKSCKTSEKWEIFESFIKQDNACCIVKLLFWFFEGNRNKVENYLAKNKKIWGKHSELYQLE